MSFIFNMIYTIDSIYSIYLIFNLYFFYYVSYIIYHILFILYDVEHAPVISNVHVFSYVHPSYDHFRPVSYPSLDIYFFSSYGRLVWASSKKM